MQQDLGNGGHARKCYPYPEALPRTVRLGCILIAGLWVCGGAVGILVLLLTAPSEDSRLTSGILPVYLLPIPFLAAAFVVRFYHSRRTGDSEEPRRGKRGVRGDTYLIYGICSIFVILMYVAFMIADKGMDNASSRCRGNMGTIEIALQSYASDNVRHFYPELAPTGGKLVMRTGEVAGKDFFRDCLGDWEPLICPGDGDALELVPNEECPSIELCSQLSSYMYLGYAIHDESEMEAFSMAYKKRLDSSRAFDDNLAVPDRSGKSTRVIVRLREQEVAVSDAEGEEPRLSNDGRVSSAPSLVVGDAAEMHETGNCRDPNPSRVPLLIERHGHHMPSGGYVLFLDGHLEYMRYPGRWPMTEKTMAILRDMEAYRPRQQGSKGP